MKVETDTHALTWRRLHTVTAEPKFAPAVTIYVVQYHRGGRFYVTRRPETERLSYFSAHSAESLALRAAMRRARLYEEAYSVDRRSVRNE